MKEIIINKIKTQSFQSSFFKGMTGFLMFISVYLMVRFLGNSDYGILVLIFGFFQWGLYFDFGIANVLKSKIPELIHKNKTELINQYIRESIILTSVLAIILFLVFYTIINEINLNSLLKIKNNSINIQSLFILNCVFFCINFILSINKSLYIGVLNPKISEISSTITQFFFCISITFILVFNLSTNSETNLLTISWINGLCTILVNLFFLILFFIKQPYTIFHSKKINFIVSKKIVSKGFQFMLLQIFMVIIFFSDPYLISSFCSSEEVGSYDIITKLFQLPLLIITSGLASYWPFFSKKYHEKDVEWFKNIFSKFEKYFTLLILLLICFGIISKWIIKIWVGDYYFNSISYLTLILMSIGVLGRIYFTFYANFFNGIHQLKSQIYILGITALIKIPISIVLLKNGGGITGLFFLLAFFMLIWGMILRFESKKIIKTIHG